MQVSNSGRASVNSIERVLIVASKGMLRGSNDGSGMVATQRPPQDGGGEGLQPGAELKGGGWGGLAPPFWH